MDEHAALGFLDLRYGVGCQSQLFSDKSLHEPMSASILFLIGFMEPAQFSCWLRAIIYQCTLPLLP